ncbi:MAG TPA: mandelate racemase/muconate lactonizing enzyme family protein [Polaromonas sp.]|uniref:mandelate racemase/muconate lactonizing enzyme family protein n=1 Tax=Polaromonas sp. TaxID=1869339 RepID=UPI002D5BBB50|nr:mandelate racemase/muconate lactonizing enzyme family protein [Polaromonas sp.]HYW55568.1 mandelate racemase/muconate lactonizing enzyme family protein [Polaromonas sp.]
MDVHPLQITQCRHWKVAMPFRQALEWGSGSRPGVTRLVVEITLANGVKGYGETICLLEFIEPVLVHTVFPIALQHRAQDVERFTRHVFGAGYYHHKRAAVMAMAAVEMAMWDAQAKVAGQTLSALWGGVFRSEVEVAAYLFGTDASALTASAQRFADAGYRSFKVKIGMDAASDISNVEAVRKAVGAMPLRADVNSAWTPGTARRTLERLRAYDLQYIEQPLELDDVQGHAELRKMQPVPVALDESAYTLADVGNIVRSGAADVILLDPHEIGGMWQTIKAAAVAESVGIPVTLHSGGELGFSQSAYIHLAASIPNMSISIDSERDYLSDDVVCEPPRVENGVFAIPQGSGLGMTPDFTKIERYQASEIRGAYLDSARPGWFSTKPSY